ncbi:hypothetical protein, partial [Streptomyces cadmiisoli]|uniref:hypothetical protein n=1 Tax=Streptomyces cadmiisoli TaxID=2184053 RepID=UPI00365DC1F1
MTSKWVAPNGAVTFDWHRSKDRNTGKVTETRSPERHVVEMSTFPEAVFADRPGGRGTVGSEVTETSRAPEVVAPGAGHLLSGKYARAPADPHSLAQRRQR